MGIVVHWRIGANQNKRSFDSGVPRARPIERNRRARRGPRKRAGPSCAQDARTYWYFGQNWRWRLVREIEILNSLHGLRLNYELKHPERRRVPARFLQRGRPASKDLCVLLFVCQFSFATRPSKRNFPITRWSDHPIFLSVPNARIFTVSLPIRLIAVDIDGTLIDSTLDIPAGNLQALRRAHDAGVEIVLVTGRRHRFALPVAEQLGFEFCLISSNGAITRSTGGELFHADMLPRNIAHRLCEHMVEFSGCTVLTFDKDARGAIVVERTDELGTNIQRWIDKNRMYIEEIAPITKALVCDPVQAMFCGTVERMKPAEARLNDGTFAGQINVLKTQYDHRDLCILDVLRDACSKGSALARWAAHLGIPRSHVMAIGDNYNDIEMLEYAGFPFVMANASEDLKRSGWPVTLDNEACGVAAAIDEVLAN